MTATMTEQAVQTLNIVKDISIAAPIEVAFDALLAELGPEAQMHDGAPYPFKFEPWPGGRWFRDLGEAGGHKYGHLWGHVQVIKAPTLLEIRGPFWMSYPGINFLQYRLKADGAGTLITLTHRAMGLFPEDLREGVTRGWGAKLNRVAEIAERRSRR
jgi:uncharacterized protein YndB with AHSA1/START domain